MAAEPTTITASDVDALNRTAVTRSAWLSRAAGTALVVVGIIGLLAWLWVTVRLQQRADQSSGATLVGSTSVDIYDRLDLFVQTVTAGVIAALAVCGGFMLRSLSDYLVAGTGGSITGFEEGDPVPETAESSEAAGAPPGGDGAPSDAGGAPEFGLEPDPD